MPPRIKYIKLAYKDDIAWIQLLIELPFVNHLQVDHALIIPCSFGKLLRICHLHFNVVNCASSIPDIHIQPHTLGIGIWFYPFLQFRIFYVVNVKFRENSLEQLPAQLCILHYLPKQKIIGYA